MAIDNLTVMDVITEAKKLLEQMMADATRLKMIADIARSQHDNETVLEVQAVEHPLVNKISDLKERIKKLELMQAKVRLKEIKDRYKDE